MIFRRRFSKRRLTRWLAGKVSLGSLLRLKDRDRDQLSRQAYRQLEAEDFPAAERLFGLLGQLWPELDSAAQLGRGVCAQRQGDLAEAERSYDRVLDTEPANVYALANRAEVRLLTDRKDAARTDLAEALAALAGKKLPEALRRRVEKLQTIATTES